MTPVKTTNCAVFVVITPVKTTDCYVCVVMTLVEATDNYDCVVDTCPIGRLLRLCRYDNCQNDI